MNITEVRVHIESKNDPTNFVLAFADITVDGVLKIHDIRILLDQQGVSYVAMPNRKTLDRCPSCNGSNHLRAKYCNECGIRLADNRGRPNKHGKIKFYTDICHPLETELRSLINSKVLAQYNVEKDIAFEAQNYKKPL